MRILLLMTALAPLLALAEGPAKIAVAVVGFNAVQEVDRPRAELLSEAMVTEAARSGSFSITSMSEIRSALGAERQRQLLGCNETSSCIAELAGALGSRYLLTGTVGSLGKTTRLDIRLVDTADPSKSVRAAREVAGEEGDLSYAVRTAVREVLQAIAPEGVTLPAVPSTRDSSGVRVAAWVLGGVGVALLAAGAVTGGLTLSSYDATRAASNAGDVAAYDAMANQTRGRAAATDVLLATGVAAAGTAVVLFFVSRAPVQVAVAPTRGGLGLAVGGTF
jgi:TolB-like protein